MLHELSEDELFEHVFHRFFQDNPQLTRGERMFAPVSIFANGHVLSPDEAAVQYDLEVTPEMVLTASSWKVAYDEHGIIEPMNVPCTGVFHPYKVQTNDELATTVFPKIGELVPVAKSSSIEEVLSGLPALQVHYVPASEEYLKQLRTMYVRGAIQGAAKIDPPFKQDEI